MLTPIFRVLQFIYLNLKKDIETLKNRVTSFINFEKKRGLLLEAFRKLMVSASYSQVWINEKFCEEWFLSEVFYSSNAYFVWYKWEFMISKK